MHHGPQLLLSLYIVISRRLLSATCLVCTNEDLLRILVSYRLSLRISEVFHGKKIISL